MGSDESTQLPERGEQRTRRECGFVVVRIHKLKIGVAGYPREGYGVANIVHASDV